MQVTEYAPGGQLAPFVRTFRVVEAAAEATRLLIPEPGLVLGIRYRGFATLLEEGRSIRMANATITGVGAGARRMHTSAGGGLVLAVFHPAGAAQFFSEPLHALFGTTGALDQLIPRRALGRLEDRLAGALDAAGRVAILEQFLTARLALRSPDPVVAAAVRAIHESRGSIRISALAGHLAISQDPLEKRFRRAVGASPKQLASLLRIRHAITSYRPGTSLTRLSQEAGYFDQSHFTRDFRAATGEAPGRFFRTAQYC